MNSTRRTFMSVVAALVLSALGCQRQQPSKAKRWIATWPVKVARGYPVPELCLLLGHVNDVEFHGYVPGALTATWLVTGSDTGETQMIFESGGHGRLPLLDFGQYLPRDHEWRELRPDEMPGMSAQYCSELCGVG